MTNAFHVLASSVLCALSSGKVIPSVKPPPKPNAAMAIQTWGMSNGANASPRVPAPASVAQAASHPRRSCARLNEPNTGIATVNATVYVASTRPADAADRPCSRYIGEVQDSNAKNKKLPQAKNNATRHAVPFVTGNQAWLPCSAVTTPAPLPSQHTLPI